MDSCHGVLAGRVRGGAAVDAEVHPVSTLSSFLSCSLSAWPEAEQ